MFCFERNFIQYKMSDLIEKTLLAGDKFMSEINLRQPQFTYIACGPLTKNKERIKKIQEI